MLHFQTAGVSAGSLLEHILLESMGALRGGGIFAWANSGGASSLIADPTFQEFLKDGTFRLVVGLDSITDVAAIKKLEQLETKIPNFNVELFLNSARGMFHPKMVWFEFADHVTLIVGSGNLTMGGMLANLEAFVVTKESGARGRQDLKMINDWLRAHDHELVPVDDQRALDRAALNSGNERSIRFPAPKVLEVVTDADAELALVAEFPASGVRPSQVNFDLSTYTNFFGASAGTQRRIILHSVSPAGRLGALESRPSVEVASKNYRFELAAAKGTYPETGRPIGVFLRLQTGEFLYVVLMPGDTDHPTMEAFLAERWSGRADRMRRITTDAEDLRSYWPAAPIWKASLPEI